MRCLRIDNKHYYIYKITNLINNKVYIGKTSRTIQERYEEHLIFSKFDERPLYRAMRKYGIENFHLEEIDDCNTNEEANELEKYYIKKYNSYIYSDNSNGYNCTLGGDGSLLLELDEKKVIQYYLKNNKILKTAEFFNVSVSTIYRILKRNDIVIKDYNNQKAVCMMKNGNIIRTFNSVAEANKFFGKDCNHSGIRNVLYGKNKSAYGYNWKYLNCTKTNIVKKPIVMVKDGEIVKIFSTHQDAYQYLNKSLKSKNISKVLNGKLKTAYGFEWYYADEYLNENDNQILMLKNGKIIETFQTLKEANISLDKSVKSRNISKVLCGQTKTAYGYEWEYAKNFLKIA